MKIRVFAAVLSVLLVLPCVSFATSISKTGSGNSYIALSTDHFSDKIAGIHRTHDIDWSRRVHTGPGWPYGNSQAWWYNKDDCRPHRPPHHNPAPTPIPAAFWLLGTGLVGLFGIRRRMGG